MKRSFRLPAHGRLYAAIGALGASLALTACGSGSTAAGTNAAATNAGSGGDEPTFVVGQQESGIVSLSKDIDAFKGAPYHVKFAVFPDGPPLVAAVAAGKVDLGDLGDVPPIAAASKNLGFKLIAAEPPVTYKDVGDYIIVPKGSPITSYSQLKGKKIGVPFGSSANGFILNALQSVGLSPADVDLVNLLPAAAQAAFQSHSIDALALWNPQVATDVAAGARIIGYGRPPLDPDTGFYVGSDKDLSDPTRRADLRDLLERLGAAYQYGDSHHAQWEAGIEHETGVTPAVAKTTVDYYPYVVRPITPKIIANVQNLADTFYKAKQIGQPVKIASLVDNLLPSSYAGTLPKS